MRTWREVRSNADGSTTYEFEGVGSCDQYYNQSGAEASHTHTHRRRDNTEARIHTHTHTTYTHTHTHTHTCCCDEADEVCLRFLGQELSQLG